MEAAFPPFSLAHAPLNVITTVLQSMSLRDRFTCALVCKAWAEAATAAPAATRSIILRDRIQDVNCFQTWLEKHGGPIEVLQLYTCPGSAALTALPCPQLQELLLSGSLSVDGSVWNDIAAATKLTSVSLDDVWTESQQADVVSALTALPDLEQLTWSRVSCRRQWGLSDSKLLQKLTKLTALQLDHASAAAALQHLGLLTRLQDLHLAISNWATADCPGLQELKALTRLELMSLNGVFSDIPASVSQLSALQQLHVPTATYQALNSLQVLTRLTQLCIQSLLNLTPGLTALQLPGLQHLEVWEGIGTMPMSYLVACTQLQLLVLRGVNLSGPGSLVASSMLQHLELQRCRVSAAGPVAWQQVFTGPGRLPHLTSLQLTGVLPDLQQVDMVRVVACCSSLQELHLTALYDSFASALTRLSGFTSLTLERANDWECSSLAQLTGLRELRVVDASKVFAAGLRQLAALEQLTSLGLHNLGWSSAVLRKLMSDRLPGPRTYQYVIINQVCVPVCVWEIVGGSAHTQVAVVVTLRACSLALEPHMPAFPQSMSTNKTPTDCMTPPAATFSLFIVLPVVGPRSCGSWSMCHTGLHHPSSQSMMSSCMQCVRIALHGNVFTAPARPPPGSIAGLPHDTGACWPAS